MTMNMHNSFSKQIRYFYRVWVFIMSPNKSRKIFLKFYLILSTSFFPLLLRSILVSNTRDLARINLSLRTSKSEFKASQKSFPFNLLRDLGAQIQKISQVLYLEMSCVMRRERIKISFFHLSQRRSPKRIIFLGAMRKRELVKKQL